MLRLILILTGKAFFFRLKLNLKKTQRQKVSVYFANGSRQSLPSKPSFYSLRLTLLIVPYRIFIVFYLLNNIFFVMFQHKL